MNVMRRRVLQLVGIGVAMIACPIVASALEAGCDTLYSEDMQHGRVFHELTIRNPFRQGQT